MILVIFLVIVQVSGFVYPPQEIIINRDETSGLYLPVNSASASLKMTLKELKCCSGGFFRARIQMKSSLPALPSIDSAFPLNNCHVRIFGDQLRIEIPGQNFQECGVSNCGENLCLRMRFPHVKGLKTASDGLLTLKCRPQKPLVTQNQILRLSVEENQVRRDSSVIEGGSQMLFRSQMGLFKRNRLDGSFSEALTEGGEVLLGEPLMLKAQVRPEDGWNFTGMSDISLSRLSPAGEILHSANLITREGCVNPAMRSICSENPSFDPPLGQKLRFKAASFPGMISGEEIVLNVRLYACLNPRDCLPNLTKCRSRIKRSFKDSQFEESRISFRVTLPNGQEIASESQMNALIPIFGISGLAILCFGCFLSIAVLWRRRSRTGFLASRRPSL
ncbi:uncharacterized protein LOC132265855 [Phlebotomus argentipes]|uniref:uncharacterized protein LOC132265855 n=1 Tax=Phlebotomus argentipes TaxID=94469 RepID=UPI0028931168|nr:uncharacterized protein LOC132265855 [Phlebotomus argentipes]